MPIVFGQYRKYVFTSWTQPVLTDNTSSTEFTITDPELSGGTVDPNNNYQMTWGSSPMEDFSNVYKSMDSDINNDFYLQGDNAETTFDQVFTVFDIEFDKPLKISHLSFSGPTVVGYHCSLVFAQVYNVKEDGTIERIFNKIGVDTIEGDITPTICKKIRICLMPNTDNGSFHCLMKSIVITATKATSTTEGTADDYDYFGNTIRKVYYGSTEITDIYSGSTKVF